MKYIKSNWPALLIGMLVLGVLAFGGTMPDASLAGLAAVPFVIGDTKSVEDVLRAFEQFKEANNAALDEIRKKGIADPLLTAKVEKANEAVTKLETKLEAADTERKAEKARMDALEATLKRVQLQGAGGTSAVEAKVMKEYAAFYGGGGEVTEKTFIDHKAALHLAMRKGDFSKIKEFEAKAMSVDSQPDGGFWVLPDTTGRIVAKVFETSPMRQYAAVQGISTDALEGDYDLDEASSGWVGERSARTETNSPQVGTWRIPVHELYAMPSATQKLLDDAAVDPEAWLAGKVSNKFGRDEAAAFVSGDGINKPRGFLTYGDGVPSKSNWKVIERTKTGVNGDFAASNKADIFIEVMGKMKDFYLNGAIWAMNRTVRAAVRKIKDANGQYILAMDASEGFRSQIFGIQVVSFEDMPALATGSLSIALGNFAQAYQIVDRVGIRVLRDPFTAKPKVLFYTTKRVGGDVINHEAIKLIEFSA